MDKITMDNPQKLFFETLGNQTRWDIVHLLHKKPYRATDIAKRLGYEQSLVSHHLQRLLTCGFVMAKKNSTERIYSLNKETITPLLILVDRHVNKFCKKICIK